MIDVTQPIRRKEDHAEAVLVASDLDGMWPYLVRYKVGNSWSALTYAPDHFEATFENVPPPPRKIKVWLREDTCGYYVIENVDQKLSGAAIGSAYVTEGQWADKWDKP